MTKKIYMVLIVQNTGEFPYQLAADIADSATALGNFTLVKVVTPYEQVRALLLHAIGTRIGEFRPNHLSARVPWAPSAGELENRHKFANCFIEGCEGLEIGIDQTIFAYAFKGALQQIVADAPDDSKILFVVSDVRSHETFDALRSPDSCHNFVAVRAIESRTRRSEIACLELDNSYLESFAKECKNTEFDFNLTWNARVADEVAVLQARVNAMPVELE